ncbi:thioredoxin domain-containing protein [Aliarcobacter butzleri]|uniref:DsbA family protein n=1 Tax=Aliarcobacter butzleri TaxID=28197 RepID=UPI0021B2BE52|nr:thioredoxin domain-containing protein [Aliarcobacter butzleri]MCT7566657.1 thioredoxin domain-containing protein [Aliarcobacter butzleri]MCT7571414.1 thioredoxin domain-containing protein [Aliarcobacter butzleri]MCT7596682.1 thioredoxin domain-containing protein [Aliarcobacter butzleri]MCT7631958.1 thioredoxin domain-containing protein [Aliarcobacter butzleri]MCT7639479.1 thioredoxin domain-containing protein [Aliarcobacter butzleri]
MNFTKILSLSVILSASLFANDSTVVDFEKKRVAQNPNVKVKDVKVNTKKDLPLAGWNGYILDVEAIVQEKSLKVKDILFSNGDYIALDLIDAKTGKSLKDLVTPNLTSNYYDKTKLIAGNHNAKDKIVVFSDPLCPFCMEYIPEVINYVNKNSDSIALYYYAFPLVQIHPASEALSKIIEVAKNKGVKDIELKAYKTDWETYFSPKENDEKKILEAFNKELKTNIKLEEIASKDINEKLSKDMSMGEEVMVTGTPTIFVNGVKDTTRELYKTLGKK